jgi:hypothetical protein
VHLVRFLFIVVFVDERNHEPEIYKLKGKSRKIFDMILSTKICSFFLNFVLEGGLQLGSPPPLGAPMVDGLVNTGNNL